MTTLDSAAAIRRGRAALGRPDGLGMCLYNNWLWWGGVQSIGPGAGHYDVALAGWNYSPEQLHPMDEAPAGVPVWFGISPTRTDHNKEAGDVGLSLGNGLGIFTDSPGGATGIMSFRSRALQIQRPALGFTTDFLGHATTAGLAYSRGGTAVKVSTPATRKGRPMSSYILQAPSRKDGPRVSVLIEPGTATWLDGERYAYFRGLQDGNGTKLFPVVQGNERSYALAVEHRTVRKA